MLFLNFQLGLQFIRMLAKLIHLNYTFSRSRLRKGPVLDKQLKDLTQTYIIKGQMKAARQKFQKSNINETFTEVLKQAKPKLRVRFKVDTVKLSKDLKQKIKLRINPSSLSAASQKKDDLKFLNQSRSYLNDQTAQIEFQQKFQRELFMKKQTARMIKKQDNNYKNFLPESEGNRYNTYLDAKMKLKNSRIQSMMNYKRNNEELKLLIDSGLMDQPQNLQVLINRINGQSNMQIEEHEHIPQIGFKQPPNQTNYLEEILTKQLSEKQTMISKVDGPEQLRDYGKIQQFMEMYNHSTDEQKKKSSDDVNLLLNVRQYERSLFLSRYQQINFRFKGRVQFDYFKQTELLSYLKHEPIEPKQLLMIFQQNKQALNRFNVPIITPAVMSRIYSRTSTYKFSETDQNNHINMLNDPVFKRLQKSLFRELDKISDQLFCDTVWAYAKNHELQEGILNMRVSDAIQGAIFNQIGERINRLRQVDLGLLMRSIIKLNLLNNQNYLQKWVQIIESLQHRLPLMKESYEYESVMEFITLVPETAKSVNLIANNIAFFKRYQWQSKETLMSFLRVSSALISNSQMIDILEHNKTFILLKEIVNAKVQNIKPLISTVNINEMPKMILVLQELNKYPMGPEIPTILMNIAKKQIVHCIHTQKDKLYQYTISSVITTLSAFDYFSSLLQNKSKYIDRDELLIPFQNKNIMKIVPLRHLLPGRVLPFNSKLYFVYHQLAKLLQKQSAMLSNRSISDSLMGLSMVQYKNEGIFDSMTYRILQKIQKQQRERGVSTLSPNEVTELIKVIGSYSLQKRSTDLIEQIYDTVLSKGKNHFKSIQLNFLINFFAAYVNLFTLPTEQPNKQNNHYAILMQKWIRNKSTLHIFIYSYRHYLKQLLFKLQKEQIITLYFVNSLLLNNVGRIMQSNQQCKTEFTQIHNSLKRNTSELFDIVQSILIDKLQIGYRFLLCLCLELNEVDIEKITLFKNQNQANFEAIQKEFYDKYIKDILNHEQNVGTSISYTKAYAKILNQLQKQKPSGLQNIQQKAWRIEIQNEKKVYFFATYEHLMSKTDQSGISLGLFGLWKIYAQMYRRKGWSFELVCTHLEE